MSSTLELMGHTKKVVEETMKKAAKAEKMEDALRFSQAAYLATSVTGALNSVTPDSIAERPDQPNA